MEPVEPGNLASRILHFRLAKEHISLQIENTFSSGTEKIWKSRATAKSSGCYPSVLLRDRELACAVGKNIGDRRVGTDAGVDRT